MPEQEDRKCPYEDLCEKCHPELEFVKKRCKCDCDNCRLCGVYWAFHDGYTSLDEI